MINFSDNKFSFVNDNYFFNINNLDFNSDILKKILIIQEKKNIDLELKNFDLLSKMKELNNSLIEFKVDIENIRKRSQKDLENAYKYNIDIFVKEYLNIIDNLEHGLLSCKEISDSKVLIIYKGLELIYKSAITLLKKFGVDIIDPKNEKFNPLYHEAVSVVDDVNYLPSIVIDVVQKGYIIYGKVLRHAKVIVSKSI